MKNLLFFLHLFVTKKKHLSLQKKYIHTHTCCIKNKQVWRDIKYLSMFKGRALRTALSFKNGCLQFIVFIFTQCAALTKTLQLIIKFAY